MSAIYNATSQLKTNEETQNFSSQAIYVFEVKCRYDLSQDAKKDIFIHGLKTRSS